MINEKQFNLWFAVGSRQYLWLLLIGGVKNILFSYIYQEPYKSKILLKRHKCNLFLDSGAFTAWSKGNVIDIDDYIKWVKGIKKDYPYPVICANLDVIPGRSGVKVTQEDIDVSATKGWENYLYMKSKGLESMHIFHQGEDFKWLKKMLKECKYIGISPCNDFTDKKKDEWLYITFGIIKKEGMLGKIKTHAFGMTSVDLLKKYPFYSADSSAYAFTSAFGIVHSPYGKIVISKEQDKHKDYIEKKPPEIKEKLIKYIESFGFSYRLAQDNYKFRNIINISHYLKIESDINKSPVKFNDSQKALFDLDYDK